MAEVKDVQAGDPCPTCGGEFAIDPLQHPDTLIDRRRRNTDNPGVAMRYEKQVQAKAAEFGLIHKCTICGYAARFQPAPAPTS